MGGTSPCSQFHCLFAPLRQTLGRLKPQRHSPPAAAKAPALFALVFGLFLGLCLWKFGDPVILDHKIVTPGSLSDFWGDAWPTHWANWVWPFLALWGAWLVWQRGAIRWPSKWLCWLPPAWLGWQFVAATHTVDSDLTAATLWQFGGCVACFFLGALLFGTSTDLVQPAADGPVRAPGVPGGTPATKYLLLAGILAAFTFCLIRAVDQRVFEYPVNYQVLAEGERAGWTNFPPATIDEMKTAGVIIHTNGVDVANPVILAKFQKGRVCGTLVYPNALAQIILLLWPAALALAFGATRNLRPVVRLAAIGITLFLGGAAFFWTGSKLGWLIAIGVAGLLLFRMNGSKTLKLAAIAAVVVLGLGVFAVRFHHYFAAGATSAGARFDYWRAAVQITRNQPLFGSGPGTFGVPYSQIKSPQSEMARLTHNDFLEQFCDSGLPGGLLYGAWIGLALVIASRRFWQSRDSLSVGLLLGLLGWFAQGFGEFGLYVPALAWIAFTLLGGLVGQAAPLR